MVVVLVVLFQILFGAVDGFLFVFRGVDRQRTAAHTQAADGTLVVAILLAFGAGH